jgi:hypothetical protein
MRAATRRRTRAGAPIGLDERIAPRAALDLFLGPLDQPGGRPRRVAPGVTADLCLLKAPLAEALGALSCDLVAATVVDGRLVHQAG